MYVHQIFGHCGAFWRRVCYVYICVFVKMLSIELVRTCAHARAHCGATSESIGTWILADIHGVALKAGA